MKQFTHCMLNGIKEKKTIFVYENHINKYNQAAANCVIYKIII